MAELPEIARQKLKQAAAGPHPDADLLTAFAENSLTARERTRVLEHLAACASCREVVALAAPEQVAAASVSPVRARASRRWSIARWGTAAATVVVLVSAVWIGRMQRTAAPRPAAELAQAAPESTSEAAPAAKQKEEPAAPATAAEVSKKTAPAREVASRPLEKNLADAEKPAGAPQAGGVTAAKLANAEPGAGVAAGVAKPRVALPSVAGAESASKAAALDRLEAPKLEAQKDELREQAAAPAAAATTSEMKAAMARRPAAPAGVSAEANAPATANRVTPPRSAASPVNGRLAAAAVPSGVVGGVGPAAAKAITRWTISGSGALQRSLDDGKSWQDVPVAAGVVFRAVSAIGNEVWAGGNGGTLYHSSNGGGSWTQVTPASGGATLSGDIVRIDFADPRRGSLATSTGQTWLTSDGGRSWALR